MPPSHRTFTALSALLLAVNTSCTSGPASPMPQTSPAQSADTASPSLPTPAATSTVPHARLSVPAVTSSEVSRVVYTAQAGTMKSEVRRQARAGKQYLLQAACDSATPGRVIKYELLSSKPASNTPVASGELTCDGQVTSTSTLLPATAIQISLGPDLTGVASAYAVITPST